MSSWRNLAEALDRRSALGSAPAFWLRDDDAVSVTEPLNRLADLTRDAGVPTVLAVIPARAEPSLADWMSGAPHMRAAVHGFNHANHAPQGEKPQEYGPHRPVETMREELQAARAGVQSLFGARARPMFVPPWNRMTPALAPALPSLGFRSLSLFGPIDPRFKCANLILVNCDVDLVDWRGTRRCRPHEEMVGEVVALLGARTQTGEPIGILTHHLAHDEAAWTFLSRMFEATAGRASWIAPS